MQITFKSQPMTLAGKQLAVGDVLPDFVAAGPDLSPVRLGDTQGARLFLTVPSLDTPVCDREALEVSRRVQSMPLLTCYVVSMDLPFAQKRWCAAQDVANLVTLSDYKDRSFARATGTLIQELGLLTRAAFVVNADNLVTYAEYVPEVTEHPDYAALLAAAQKA